MKILGYRAFVHNNEGSTFIKELCNVLGEEKDRSIWEVVTEITQRVATTVLKYERGEVGQCPETTSTLSSDYRFRDESNTGE